MARSREFDDAAAVQAALELFWERGYLSTSLIALQDATGLSRSSLYAAYGSKRGLFERAIQAYWTDVVGPLLGPMEEPEADVAAVSAFFREIAAVLRSSDTRLATRGCMILNLTTELDELDAATADLVCNYRDRVYAAILNALSATTSIPDPDARAEVLTASHVGIMMMTRINPGAAATASETIAADIDSW